MDGATEKQRLVREIFEEAGYWSIEDKRMSDAPQTRPSLLVRIRDAQDGRAWAEFVEIYAPLVYAFVRRGGLQDADAADLTQEVLCAVARAARRLDYQPERGTFRSWLLTVTRNKLRNYLSRQQPGARGSGDSAVQGLLDALPDPEQDDVQQWNRQYRQRVLEWASVRVRPMVEERTWQAFWQTAVLARAPVEVAQELGLSVANVYRAKNRVIVRLKELVQELEAEWESQ